MGIGGISIWQLLIILAIVLVLFGAKRLKNLGPDLGSAIGRQLGGGDGLDFTDLLGGRMVAGRAGAVGQMEAARSLGKGEVTDPLRSPSGFHIIKGSPLKSSALFSILAP